MCLPSLFLQCLNVNCKGKDLFYALSNTAFWKPRCSVSTTISTDTGDGERASTSTGASAGYSQFPCVFQLPPAGCIVNHPRPKMLDLSSLLLVSVTSCSASSLFLPSLFFFFSDTHKPESLKDNSFFKNATPQDLIKL